MSILEKTILSGLYYFNSLLTVLVSYALAPQHSQGDLLKIWQSRENPKEWTEKKKKKIKVPGDKINTQK